MKILIVNSYYYPNMVGGTENSVKLLAENLKNAGNDVAVYCIDGNEKIKKEIINGVAIYRGVGGNYKLLDKMNNSETTMVKIKNKIIEINNKRIKELNPLQKELIEDLFPNFNENLIIKSWRNKNSYEKGDIFIKINNTIKTISIKKGSRNSVHVERLDLLKKFLRELGIKNEVLEYYENFHYGIDKDNSNKVLSAKEYKAKYKTEIEIINKNLLTINIEKIIDRFILSGKFAKNKVDAIVYGTPNDFLWINKEDITKIIKSNLNNISNGIHISCLFIQPLNRCLNNNTKYLKYRDYIQVKWYSLFDDIIKYKNNKLKF